MEDDLKERGGGRTRSGARVQLLELLIPVISLGAAGASRESVTKYGKRSPAEGKVARRRLSSGLAKRHPELLDITDHWSSYHGRITPSIHQGTPLPLPVGARTHVGAGR